jgi:DNA-binding beta-propeller fold protein YncE
VLLVTFHSGNVRAYADGGGEISKNVLDPVPTDAELRALQFGPGGALWVVNGSKSQSAILGYTGSGSSYSGGGPVAEYPDAEALWHPFDFTFSPDGSECYVSNQDTNVVARFVIAPGGTSMTAAPVAPALQGTFLDGTFVASSRVDLCGVRPTTPVDPQKGGLSVACDPSKTGCCKPTNSVRGVLWTNGVLYVADEVGNAVRVYGLDGTYLGSGSVPSPVHLLEAPGQLYVTGSGGIFIADLASGPPWTLTFPSTPSVALANAAGMTPGANNSLYVVTRESTNAEIYEFALPLEPGEQPTTSFGVHSSPEFVLYVPDA